MLIIRFLRFFMGYVGFSAKGGFCERFINLCTVNGIPLWNMKRDGDTLYARTTVDGYKAIRQSAYRSGVKMKLEGKYGLPFFLENNKKRLGIAIGLTVSFMIVFLLSTMVWSITVKGNKKLTQKQVLGVFEQLGVKKGAFAKKIKASEVSDEAEKLLPELLWASVNIKGSKVEIVVCERTDAPEFPDTGTPCNIVADEDGVITSVQANIGKEAISPGDAVIKGDLLISGITDNLDGTENLVSARGNVFAEVKRTLLCDGSEVKFSVQTSKQSRNCLYLFGLKIPLGKRVSENGYFTDESYLEIRDTVLPIGIIREHSFLCDTPAQPSYDMLTLFNADSFVREYYEADKQVSIKSESFKSEKGENSICFYCEITAEKDIGVSQEIFIEKP